MWSYRAQQQSAPHGSVAPFREQPLSWGPTGDKPRGATCSQALPSTGTSLSPCPLRPLSGQTAAPAPTPVSLATAQASGATQAPKDVNLTPAPDLPVTKSSSFEKQKSPWPSPGIQWAATSPLHREAPSLPGRSPELRDHPGDRTRWESEEGGRAQEQMCQAVVPPGP